MFQESRLCLFNGFNGVKCPHLFTWKQIHAVSEMSYYILEFWKMDEVQELSNANCNIPLSELFRIHRQGAPAK
jgi:hypothetical protein